MSDPCVVCGAESSGGRNGYSLCREHWAEVEAVDKARVKAEAAEKYSAQQRAFAREYPHIEIRKGGRDAQ